MTLHQRAPYVVGLATSGTLLLLAAWGEWNHGNLVAMGVEVAWAVLVLVLAAVLALRNPDQLIPDWAHRFELVAVGKTEDRAGRIPPAVVLRCNRCDATVLPRAVKVTLPRLLSYAWSHTVLACEPRRATDPEDTRRITGHPRGPLGR